MENLRYLQPKKLNLYLKIFHRENPKLIKGLEADLYKHLLSFKSGIPQQLRKGKK
jgi:hypothetical protein